MGELFGTPAHPLLVHIPIVVLPLLAALAIAMAVKQQWRPRLLWWLVGATLINALVTFWATRSGERLEDALQPTLGSKINRHQQLGEQTAVLAAIFFVGSGLLLALDRWLTRFSRAGAWVLAAIGVVTAVWVLRTGHEGARIVWDGIDP